MGAQPQGAIICDPVKSCGKISNNRCRAGNSLGAMMSENRDLGIDLGTYYLEVKYIDHDPIILRWNTGARYTGGTQHVSPGNAFRIEPAWENEADLMPDVAINLLDKAGKSDITNSFRIVSFSGTPTKPGTVQVDVFVGGVQVPMSFEVHVGEEA